MMIASATAALPSRRQVAESDEALPATLKNRKPHLVHFGDAISMISRQPGHIFDIHYPPSQGRPPYQRRSRSHGCFAADIADKFQI